MSTGSSRAITGFGGGCHWCTEAVFQALNGVVTVEQGFIAALPPDEKFSEAVRVTFDPSEIDLNDLIAVHLATHASTAAHSMRGKYRSAIYVTDDEQGGAVRAAMKRLEEETGARFVTRVLSLHRFKPSDERFHDYYATDPQRPFCRTYIEPKLDKLRAKHAGLLR